MADPRREQLKVQEKRAILASVISPDDPLPRERALEELRGLVETAGVTVVGELIQFRDKPHMTTCFGQGKVEELKNLAKANDAEIIVVDNNLSPSQGRNLEETTETVIVDRSEVILDIFASAARTTEAKLQVELAQLLYFRPRLKRLWTHLERIEGGIGSGRGPGEKQIETDRRLLDKRVAELKSKLAEIEHRRERTVATRGDQMTVSLVGYTNAGKSTLTNALTGADVYVANKLFATLETRTRRWAIPHFGDVLLSDTVGFVRNLPHHLVASFRSTLEEARHADLLLHVVDCSHPEADQHIKTVYKVLEDIGVNYDNVLLVFNKADAVEDHSLLDVLHRHHDHAITVSAHSGQGLDRLAAAVIERVSGGVKDVVVESSVENGKLYSFLAEHADVLQTDYDDNNRVKWTCKLSKRFFKDVQNLDATIALLPSVDGAPAANGLPTDTVKATIPDEQAITRVS